MRVPLTNLDLAYYLCLISEEIIHVIYPAFSQLPKKNFDDLDCKVVHGLT